MSIGDLAVHEPDYKRLIAFLKAMEFNALMRRVGEFSGIDPSDIDAQSRLTSHAGAGADVLPSPPAGEGGAARSAAPGEGLAESLAPSPPRAAPAGGADMRLPLTGGGMTPRTPVSGDRSGNYTGTPQVLAAARTQAARNAKFDRSKYAAVRTVDDLKAWIERARETG